MVPIKNHLKRHGYGFGHPEKESLLSHQDPMQKSLHSNEKFRQIIK